MWPEILAFCNRGHFVLHGRPEALLAPASLHQEEKMELVETLEELHRMDRAIFETMEDAGQEDAGDC